MNWISIVNLKTIQKYNEFHNVKFTYNWNYFVHFPIQIYYIHNNHQHTFNFYSRWIEPNPEVNKHWPELFFPFLLSKAFE